MYTVDHEAWSTGMDEVPAVSRLRGLTVSLLAL